MSTPDKPRPGILDREQTEIARLSGCVRGVRALLLQRFGSDGALRDDEIDYLLARYMLGLTAAFYRSASGAEHLAVYRYVLGACIGTARTETAMQASCPEFPPPWTTATFASVERLGRAEGLRMQAIGFDEKEAPGSPSSAPGPQRPARHHAFPSTDSDH